MSESPDKLSTYQRQLMDYLLLGDESVTGAVAPGGSIDVPTRLGIYGHAYRHRLGEVLDTDHPVLGTYLGDDLFQRMVDGYIDAHPSTCRSLRQFGDHLALYLHDAEPFREHPQISELARFERCLLASFDAADTTCESVDVLLGLPHEAWPSLKLQFHPSVQLFETDWNVVEIWQNIKAENDPPSADQSARAWMLWRSPERLTEFRALDKAEWKMLKGFLGGSDFAEVCEALLEVLPEDQVSAAAVNRLTGWFSAGLVGRTGWLN